MLDQVSSLILGDGEWLTNIVLWSLVQDPVQLDKLHTYIIGFLRLGVDLGQLEYRITKIYAWLNHTTCELKEL